MHFIFALFVGSLLFFSSSRALPPISSLVARRQPSPAGTPHRINVVNENDPMIEDNIQQLPADNYYETSTIVPLDSMNAISSGTPPQQQHPLHTSVFIADKESANKDEEEEEEEDPCPVCLEDPKSPADIIIFVDSTKKRICEHSCCKRCAFKMIISAYYQQRHLPIEQRSGYRCMQCRQQYEAAMSVRPDLFDSIFTVFDLNGNEWISQREFHKGMKTLRLDRYMSAQQMDDAFNSVDIRGQQMISRQQLADLWRILRQDFGQWLERPTTISDEELMRSPPNAMRMSRDADDDYDYRGRDAYIRMLNSPCGKYCCIIVPGFCGPAVMGVDLSCYMAGLPVSGCLTAFVCCLFSAINFYNANT